MLLQGKCCAFCTSHTWWTLVVQNQQLSKESSRVINIAKYFQWCVYRRSSAPTNTGVSTTTSLELILRARKLSLLRVVVSKVQLPRSVPNLFLLMTLSSQLPPLTIRTYVERWNKRGVTLSLQLCSKGPGQFASGPGFTLTMYTPRYLFQRIIGNRLSRKPS